MSEKEQRKAWSQEAAEIRGLLKKFRRDHAEEERRAAAVRRDAQKRHAVQVRLLAAGLKKELAEADKAERLSLKTTERETAALQKRLGILEGRL